VALLIVAAAVLLAAWPAPPPLYAGTATARPDTTWDNRFQAYGNSSGAWNGGDGAQALVLPGGATMWFFADSYLGALSPGETRSPFTTGTAHNSAVLYRNGVLGPTYAGSPGPFGYSGTGDYTWVGPPPPYSPARYELINGDQVIDDGIVYKFFQLADRDLHPGGFGYKLVGTVIESFTIDPATDALYPAGGRPAGVADWAGSDPLLWGAATLAYHGYLYIYGVKPYHRGSDQYPLYLARVPAGGLAAGDAWQYFDGTPGCPGSGGWTADPAAAVPLRSGVSAGFSVSAVGGQLVLLTNDMSGAGSQNNAVAYYAGCPAGFSPGNPRYLVYQPHLPPGYLAYEYRVVPQFSHGASVLVSYSVSTTSLAGNFQVVSRYRPHFLDVRLPATGARPRSSPGRSQGDS